MFKLNWTVNLIQNITVQQLQCINVFQMFDFKDIYVSFHLLNNFGTVLRSFDDQSVS